MKETATSSRFTLAVATALVAVLMLSGAAWAAPGPLAVTRTVPDSGATGVAPTANVRANFNHDMRASTVTSDTFKIRRQGAPNYLGATRSVNNAVTPTPANGGSQSVATLDPRADLAPGATYQVSIVAGSPGVKDIDGKALGRRVSWTFTTAAPPDPPDPPDTTIDSGPTGTVAGRTADISFSSSKPGSTFQCSLDGVPFADCVSPASYAGLADGEHTLRVRATDATGTPDPTPASRTWTVDATAPGVVGVSPANAATGVAQTANVTSTFSEAMDASSITDRTFTLTEQGSPSPIAAAVSYDATTNEARLVPSSALALGTTYTATLTTGVVDSVGNPLAQDRTWTFTTRSPIEVTPSPLDFLSGLTVAPCNVTITKTVTITNNTASQVDLFPSVVNTHYSVASDVLQIAPGESLELSVSWTAPNDGFRIRDPGRLLLKDAGGNTVATGDLTAIINCGIEG